MRGDAHSNKQDFVSASPMEIVYVARNPLLVESLNPGKANLFHRDQN